MEIKLTLKKVAYSITFGDSATQQSVYHITVSKEYYDEDGYCQFATLKGFFRKKQFRDSIRF